jgi:hypothetical protein
MTVILHKVLCDSNYNLHSSTLCFTHFFYLLPKLHKLSDHVMAHLVEALHYKPEGRGIDS